MQGLDVFQSLEEHRLDHKFTLIVFFPILPMFPGRFVHSAGGQMITLMSVGTVACKNALETSNCLMTHLFMRVGISIVSNEVGLPVRANEFSSSVIYCLNPRSCRKSVVRLPYFSFSTHFVSIVVGNSSAETTSKAWYACNASS